ncbi:MAG: hypothetical protein AAGA23_07375, partial [Pseudomonadota bacterium]
FGRFPQLSELSDLLAERGLTALFQHVMTAPTPSLRRWIEPLWAQCKATDDATTADFWIRNWRRNHPSDEAAVDRGVLAFLFMNVVELNPGDSIFQGANVPHAYLGGQCVEIMANSDNVLRGGLTPKYVDPVGLAAHIRFESSTEFPQTAPANLREFALRAFSSASSDTSHYRPRSLAIALSLGSKNQIGDRELAAGESALLRPDHKYLIRPSPRQGLVVVADVA